MRQILELHMKFTQDLLVALAYLVLAFIERIDQRRQYVRQKCLIFKLFSISYSITISSQRKTHIHHTSCVPENKAEIQRKLVILTRNDMFLNRGVRPGIWIPEFCSCDLSIIPHWHCPIGLAYLSRNPLYGKLLEQEINPQNKCFSYEFIMSWYPWLIVTFFICEKR